MEFRIVVYLSDAIQATLIGINMCRYINIECHNLFENPCENMMAMGKPLHRCLHQNMCPIPSSAATKMCKISMYSRYYHVRPPPFNLRASAWLVYISFEHVYQYPKCVTQMPNFGIGRCRRRDLCVRLGHIIGSGELELRRKLYPHHDRMFKFE